MKITEEQIDTFIDLYMIDRGDHPSRLKHAIYGEERQLAKKVAYAVAELLEMDKEKVLLNFMKWRSQQVLNLIYGIPNSELIEMYLKEESKK